MNDILMVTKPILERFSLTGKTALVTGAARGSAGPMRMPLGRLERQSPSSTSTMKAAWRLSMSCEPKESMRLP